ncbi:hopanoid biosynthesis-associated protein HpnK [Limobrevibacterium gyesilva]|uniref:Hopanoid biosynthesis-associated protein HpnK n=1 Tax=Limobrevibacterium gyesilva TaxID=2991712 RepID=A0AA41YUX1_9PROT|nr:hopanoid biosynthesis-associated protein HpnK [Limobrevibacterium gyesilva]MCW3476935.1 hopanoid biosynthesis-associated protein HpnK [Limobrevibacterium gyesilva]
MKRAIVSADDFGLSEAVNEGIERAYRDGILTSASLMVGAPAATDAVRRAKRLPGLRVGLHLVVIEGPAILPPAEIPDLVDARGQFPSDQLRLGVSYFFHPRVRRQLAAEIRAQFAAYAATGLVLDHADAHKHMHLHPTVGSLLVSIGRAFGLRAIRVPAEPVEVMARCGVPASVGARAMRTWSGLLRRQARRAGMAVNDAVFGLAWTGHMTTDRLLHLIPQLPDGVSEIYFHPAAGRDPVIDALMPDYDHEGELAALLSPDVRAALQREGVALCCYEDLA